MQDGGSETELARAADPINLSIIKKAWPVYWTMYESIGAELRKKREAGEDPGKRTAGE